MRWTVGLVAGSLLAGLVFGWIMKPTPAPTYEYVEVPLIKLPSVDVSWIGKLWWESIERQQRAVQKGGAVNEVAAFCGPVKTGDKVDADGKPIKAPPVPPDDLVAVVDAVEIGTPWIPLNPTSYDVFGFLNNGDRFHDRFESHGSTVIVTDGADVRVRGERAGELKPLLWTAGVLAIGIGIGATF